MFDRLRLLATYLRTRHGLRFSSREALERYQQKKIRRFLRNTLARSPFYAACVGRPLDRFPIMDKLGMMEHFDRLNTRGIKRDEAMAMAVKAEETRDFTADLNGVSVGLSTGTSGRRGLFLASGAERMRWAGIILGRMLPGSLLDAHRIAFFLRSNNNLYEAVSGRGRITFRFFDLSTPLADHLPKLRAYRPTILIAPAQVLREMARLEAAARTPGAGDGLAPRKIISVAEVLFDDDRDLIEGVFGRRVDQIYQCTEGFLACTCAEGRLHLNESFVHIEPEWLDGDRTRFFPVITDFSRVTQPIVRYRLDDVLTLDRRPCPCGSHERVISRIEGRSDDILVFAGKQEGTRAHLMPDFISRALAGAGQGIMDFRVEQTAPGRLRVLLKSDDFEVARQQAEAVLTDLMEARGFKAPLMSFLPLGDDDFMSKRRRVRRDKGIAL